MADPVEQVSNILAQRQLSTRDKGLQQQLREGVDRPGRESADMASDLQPGNINQLLRAIDAAKSPQEKAVLMQELARLKDLASNLVGPLQQQDAQETLVQRMPYDPAQGVGRPAMTVPMQPAGPRTYMDNAPGAQPQLGLRDVVNGGMIAPHAPVRMYNNTRGVIRG